MLPLSAGATINSLTPSHLSGTIDAVKAVEGFDNGGSSAIYPGLGPFSNEKTYFVFLSSLFSFDSLWRWSVGVRCRRTRHQDVLLSTVRGYFAWSDQDDLDIWPAEFWGS
jgi:hypothetical protein